MVLGQSYDYVSSSEVTLAEMGKIDLYQSKQLTR